MSTWWTSDEGRERMRAIVEKVAEKQREGGQDVPDEMVDKVADFLVDALERIEHA